MKTELEVKVLGYDYRYLKLFGFILTTPNNGLIKLNLTQYYVYSLGEVEGHSVCSLGYTS